MIGLVGFGEAGSALAAGMIRRGESVQAYDPAADRDDAAGRLLRHRAGFLGVTLVTTPAQLCRHAEILLVVVSDSVVHVTDQFEPYLRPTHLWVDLNSASPAAKLAAAQIVESTEARYLDGVLMAAVLQEAASMPILLAGTVTDETCTRLQRLGFDIEYVNGHVGAAAAIRLARSMLVKGVEALLWECAAVAHGYGVGGRIFGGLGDALGGVDWIAIADYLMRRTLVHGQRRVAELDDAVESAGSVGVAADISAAGARRLAAVSSRIDAQTVAELPDGFDALLEYVEGALRP